MRRENLWPTIEAAKQMNIVSYLLDLGYAPAKVLNEDHWYLSPLRTENTPSFKVNDKLNRWFDFGLGRGGNLVDFGVLYHGCTVRQFLEKLAGNSPARTTHLQPVAKAQINPEKSSTENKIIVIGERPLTSPALLAYLNEREIPDILAQAYCKEVSYQLNNRSYYAIGFRNNSGGFELRNRHIKLSSAPKGITTIKNGSTDLAVFEGFTDFLSFFASDLVLSNKGLDYLILNSAAFLEKSIPIISQYEQKFLLLDNDATGQNCSRILKAAGVDFEDRSNIYVGHKDLNEWLVNSKAKAKQTKPAVKPNRGYGRRM